MFFIRHGELDVFIFKRASFAALKMLPEAPRQPGLKSSAWRHIPQIGGFSSSPCMGCASSAADTVVPVWTAFVIGTGVGYKFIGRRFNRQGPPTREVTNHDCCTR